VGFLFVPQAILRFCGESHAHKFPDLIEKLQRARPSVRAFSPFHFSIENHILQHPVVYQACGGSSSIESVQSFSLAI
jgi:hypothetical protein